MLREPISLGATLDGVFGRSPFGDCAARHPIFTRCHKVSRRSGCAFCDPLRQPAFFSIAYLISAYPPVPGEK